MSRSSAANPAETLSPAEIRLCGQFAVVSEGREIALRGRQARLLVAFLAWNRHRAVGRDELIALLWPDEAPSEPDEVLSALLSKLRSALGRNALQGRRELVLALDAWVDVEAAAADGRRVEEATERGDWTEVCRAGHDVLDKTDGTFLLAHDHPWVEERRRDIEELRLHTLEHVGGAGIELGGSGIGAAERSARALVSAAPFRESGHRLLMEALAARGEVPEALRVYDALRVRLRDELGTAPSAALRDLHGRLLNHEAPERPRDERKLVSVVAGEGRQVAVFGVPRAREDDAERAVRAALELGVRAAVVSGEVLVQDGRPAGDPLDQAVALLERTPPGGVLVDELTARLTEHTIGYERTGHGFRPTGSCPRPAPRTSFVGRAHELDVLERLHRTVVAEGRPRLVLLVGEAGAGKSRLTDELLRRIQNAQPEAAIHAGRCLAYGDGLTYWPLRELLWSIARIALDDSAADAAAKLSALVDRIAAEPERTARALAISAGIALPGNPLAQSQPESVAEEVALAWPRFASGLADRAPAVLVVEDLHWAEPELLDMVERLVARAAGPLLVVATARPELLEQRPGWGARTASQLTLEPLTDDEARALVAELLPSAGPALHERVVAVAEGNPFFAEEIALHLRDHTTDVPIPTTVRAVLAARVDALPEAEKRALQDAAVMGRSFWASALTAAPASLRALEDRGLVITRPTSSLPGQTELWFRHALIREVAYRSIPDSRLQAAHAAVGDWLTGLAGDRREEFVELLAHHYERGGRATRARAVTALIEAGDAARRRSAGDDAVHFADRALALARNDGERQAALEVKARALHGAVRTDDALTAYWQGLEIADEETAARLRAHAVLMCSRYPGAFTRSDWKPWAIATIQDGLDDGSFEAGALLIGRASMARWLDLTDAETAAAREAAERAIEIAEALGSTTLLSHALEALGWRDADTGFCDAAETAERMLEIVARMPDRVEAAESMVISAVCLMRGGRFDDALATAREAQQLAQHMSPHRRLHAASAQTVCLAAPGRIAELGEATAEAVDLVLEEGERTCAMGSLSVAGYALAHYEALDEAAGARAAGLIEVTGLHRADSSFRYRGIEMLRPFVGLERTRRRLDAADEVRGLVDGVHHLRASLQLAALEDDEPLEPLSARARALARDACSPALTWIADWADAVRARKLERALNAIAALDAYGEHYTAARLAVDALVRMPDADAAAETAGRLERMGAFASAAELARIDR